MIPACYYISNTLIPTPEAPHYKEFWNWDKPYHEQKWKVKEVMSPALMQKALDYRRNVPNALTELEYYEVCEIIEREHSLIRKGFWMVVGGRPYYIPGMYYFYLQYWFMKDGRRPTYRESDRQFFVFVEYCINDPRCKGMVDYENRQQGKSSRFASLIYWASIQVRDTHIGIQSKSEADAGEFYNQCIISAWRRLPFWFKPTHDGSDDPKRQLVFRSPSELMTKKKISAGARFVRLPELNTKIDYLNAGVFAYDSKTLLFHFADEFGKTKDVDVIERLQTVGQATRKCLMCSTIEDIGADNSSIEQSTRLWEQANTTERNQNGMTANGLYRYFKPASFCFEKHGISFIDEFGQSDTKGAEAYILNQRKAIEHEVGQLMKEIRFNPLTIEEALMPPPGASSLSGIKNLIIHESELLMRKSAKKEAGIRGDFIWVGAAMHEFKEYYLPISGTTVEFRPNLNGKFYVTDMLHVQKRNNIVYNRGNSIYNKLYSQPNYEFIPKNEEIIASCDTFSYRVGKTAKFMSKGGGAVFLGGDSKDPDCHKFICYYLSRPPKIDIYLDDMAKMLYYFGCKAVIETNKTELMEHLINIGMMPCIQHKLNMGAKQKVVKADYVELGEYTDSLSLEKITVALDKYVSYFCERIDSLDAVRQLKRWKPEDSNKLDLALCMGWALLGNEYPSYKETAYAPIDDSMRLILKLL